jgi:hypothetical protein
LASAFSNAPNERRKKTVAIQFTVTIITMKIQQRAMFKTNSTFTSPDISQEVQEVQSNNDGTNGSVIRSHHENLLEDYMVENLKDTTTNATTKDMKDTTTNGHTNLSTTESVETVGVQSLALGRTGKETTKE